MKLSAVLSFFGLKVINDQIELQDVQLDSRQIKPGDLFIAIPGLKGDGRIHVAQAVANGAVAVLVQSPYIAEDNYNAVPVICVDNLRDIFRDLVAFFYNNPAKDLELIAVTGTNGKTSCSHYIAQILNALHFKCGVMGTVGNGLLDNLFPSQMTSSDCCVVQRQFAIFKKLNVTHVAMEISSHAIDQQRLLGLQFKTAIFTNLSQDHLDYHLNMREYFAAKCRLFTDYKIDNAIINLDDPYGVQLRDLLKTNNSKIKILGYSLANKQADVYLENNIIYSPWGSGVLHSSLLGSFNTSNLLACITSCALHDLALDQILKIVSNLIPVPGRMQKVVGQDSNAPMVVVDYAHTPDAMVNALQALRPYVHDGGKLYCIFGCGGDRDRSKRHMMLRAALDYSDQVVITQDNPRTEDPKQILQDILANQKIGAKVMVELDREAAIHAIILQANQQDLILIAGKGHEDYQIIGVDKLPFSDVLIASKALTLRSEKSYG